MRQPLDLSNTTVLFAGPDHSLHALPDGGVAVVCDHHRMAVVIPAGNEARALTRRAQFASYESHHHGDHRASRALESLLEEYDGHLDRPLPSVRTREEPVGADEGCTPTP